MKGVGEEIHSKDLPATDWDWIIYSQGMYDQLKRVYDDYPLSILLKMEWVIRISLRVKIR